MMLSFAISAVILWAIPGAKNPHVSYRRVDIVIVRSRARGFGSPDRRRRPMAVTHDMAHSFDVDALSVKTDEGGESHRAPGTAPTSVTV